MGPLSCDCTPPPHEGASTPVWEHSVALARYTLQQEACARHPSFEPKEEVMLCPTIFLAMCQLRNFGIQPEVDLFASHRQHQLPRCYAADPNDQNAEGYNALNFCWTSEVTVYLNPPWFLLEEVVDKIIQDGTRVLLVTPRWPEREWYRKLRKLRRERRYWRQSLYLDESGRLQLAPAWAMVVTFIPGTTVFTFIPCTPT